MIKLSKKGGYAIKSVIFIAKKNTLLKVNEISINQNIPESLLRRIIADLDRTGIIETTKGRKGGVKIGKSLELISVYDILFSVGEQLNIRECSSGEICDNIGACVSSKLMKNLQKGFNSLLKINTLDKLI